MWAIMNIDTLKTVTRETKNENQATFGFLPI